MTPAFVWFCCFLCGERSKYITYDSCATKSVCSGDSLKFICSWCEKHLSSKEIDWSYCRYCGVIGNSKDGGSIVKNRHFRFYNCGTCASARGK